MSLTGLLHSNTPTLNLIDPRGLPSRTVRYCRTSSGQDAEARIERQVFDAAGRGVAQWDARLWTRHEAGEAVTPNQTAIHSLSGQVLSTVSVDAGWRVALPGEAGQVRQAWDGRGSHRTDYDGLLRPVAAYEQAAGEAGHRVERLSYGGPAEAGSNRCGRLLRHDDPAGTRRWPIYYLRGQARVEIRNFLLTLETPDWPEDEVERDALLEPEAFTTIWTHDAFGAVLTQIDARGHERRHAYTVAGQLRESGLTLSGGTELCLVHELAYNAFGQVESQAAGNGVRSTATYDPADGRLLHLATSRPGGAQLQALSYVYDRVGNVLSIEDGTVAITYFANRKSDGLSTYAYDSLYQLIEATGRETPSVGVGPGLPGTIPLPGAGDTSVLTPYTERYVYDAGGNLTLLAHQGLQSWTRRMAIAPTSNRSLPWPENSPEPDIEAGFDANGNLRSLEGQPLAWGVRNQLRQAAQLLREDGPADREHYIYDGGNWRVRKTTLRQALAITHVAEVRYLPGLELRTNTATGEAVEVVTASAGRAQVRALHWQAGRPSDIPNDQLRYQFGDHLGSAVMELDGQAQLMSREGYYPYGATAWRAARSATEAKYKVIRYSSQERDATGLLYYGFRYYAPWLQRWVNPDPAGDVDGMNLFRMVRGNPLALIDKQGHGAVPVIGEAADDYRYLPIGLTSINELKDIRPAGNTTPLKDSDLVHSIEPPKEFLFDDASRETFSEAAQGAAFTGVAHINTGVIYLAPLRASGRSMPHTNRTWDNATVTNIKGERVKILPITHNDPAQPIPGHTQLAEKIEVDQSELVGFSVIKGVGGAVYSVGYTSRSSQNTPLVEGADTIGSPDDFKNFKFVKKNDLVGFTHIVGVIPEKWANPIRNRLTQEFGTSTENPNPFAQATLTAIALPPPPPPPPPPPLSIGRPRR
ncbi:RHS repeat-associated core domain-containing protein [Pseudomonas brassicacearum]|uniref:RHS repeat-associated core domain-containing protein n=1 Tax=Pseudomonas brassicacearum subsp. neoaurantiaca TaxID=494916 RepID=A0A7V8ZUE7_9PSED|nr:RHS repeat-associated core domain-containing protein [Pseudomonas brassicacearum]MBA1380038.1 RHS repeat-associated core domain-containing protein [Pseudomonas brassicacearum subsp. neoaurantiaca]